MSALAMDNFVSTELGNIPIDWKCVNFTSLFQCKQGVQTPVHVQVLHPRDGYKRFIRIIDLTDSSELPRYIPDPGAIHHLTNDDLFMVRYGTPGLVGFNYDGIIANNLFRLIPKSKIHSSFYYHYISFRYTDIAEMSGSSTMPAISFTALANFKILVPPFPEQQSIATALSDADAYIESLEKLIAKKRAIKKGVMQELLTGKRRLPGFSGAWTDFTIAELGDVSRGRVINRIEISKSIHAKYPVFSSQTSNNGIMGYLDTYDFEGDYITWTTDGANAGTVFARTGRFNCTNVCGTIKLYKGNHNFISDVLGLVAKSHVSRHLGNPKLMNDVMKKIQIRISKNIEEQAAIAAVISDLDSDITAHEAKLSKAHLIKQGMMQELLTGRIRLV